MGAARLSEAERYRAHREAFCLAMELGCTPREAEARLRRQQAEERLAEARRRFEAREAAARAFAASQGLRVRPTPQETFAANERLLGESHDD